MRRATVRSAVLGTLGTAALALALGGATAVAGKGEPAPGRPNVVVVMTDDQTQDSIRYMTEVGTELVDQGSSFPNSFTNWPLCCPSRVTYLTGQYAHNHQVLGNNPPEGGFERFSDDENALPVWLQAAGYYTIHVGKYLNGYGDSSSETYVPPGWSEWYAGTSNTTQTVYDYVLNQNGSLVEYGSAVEDFKQDVFSNLAVDAINRRAPGGPFFLSVAYTAPHSGGPSPNPQPPANCNGTAKPAPRHATAFDGEPLPEPPSLNEADVSDKPEAVRSREPLSAEQIDSIRREYRCRIESLLSVDEGVGRMVDALRAAGELDDTLIVFTSDNGFFQGEHRIPGGKNRVYEESIRVPLVMRGADLPAARSVPELVTNADLTATILDAAEADAGRTLDGRSLLAVAERADRLRGRELLVETNDFAAIRTARYVYAEYANGETELYDLEADPFELQSQHANPAYEPARAALAARLAALRGCAGESCRTRPALKLKLTPSERERGRSCRDPRELIARARGEASGELVEVAFEVRDRVVKVDRSAPFKDKLPRRRLGEGRRPELQIVAESIDGRVSTIQKRVRVCR